MKLPATRFSLCHLKGFVFITGGYFCKEFPRHKGIKRYFLSTAYRLNLKDKKSKWQSMPNMQRSRACHSTCGLNDSVYAFGGWYS